MSGEGDGCSWTESVPWRIPVASNSLCRIEMFGGLRVQQGDRLITRFTTQKTASLLAYLAYHLDRAHPRELLIELLWPDVDPPAGRNRLSVALNSLRRQLEPLGVPTGALLQADYQRIQLHPSAVTTD